jgi:hypothetical protein
MRVKVNVSALTLTSYGSEVSGQLYATAALPLARRKVLSEPSSPDSNQSFYWVRYPLNTNERWTLSCLLGYFTTLYQFLKLYSAEWWIVMDAGCDGEPDYGIKYSLDRLDKNHKTPQSWEQAPRWIGAGYFPNKSNALSRTGCRSPDA